MHGQDHIAAAANGDLQRLKRLIIAINERHSKSDDEQKDPCTYFVGHALDEIWGAADFRADPRRNSGLEYMNTKPIESSLSRGVPGWKLLGTVAAKGPGGKPVLQASVLQEAVSRANEGYSVIAVCGLPHDNHIVLIMPQPMPNSWVDKKKNLRLNVAQWHVGKWAEHFADQTISRSWKRRAFPDVKVFYWNLKPKWWGRAAARLVAKEMRSEKYKRSSRNHSPHPYDLWLRSSS